MKRFLLPLLAALALTTAVNAGMRFERIPTGYCSTSQKKAPNGSDCFKFTETNDGDPSVYVLGKKFPNLEIDARLCIFAFLSKSFKTYQKNLTIYNFDYSGITSKYKKFSFNWWLKRNEAFDFMKILMKKMKLKFIPSLDYFLTKLINFFIWK